VNKRIVAAVLVLAAGYFAYREFKGDVISWYAANYYVRATDYPATETPDQITLTWPGDPANTLAVNWRTAPSVQEGAIEFRGDGGEAMAVSATYTAVEDELLENDPVVHRFTAELTGLSPDTTYEYRVGAAGDAWTDWTTFTTAPETAQPFSFIYLGDAQKGLDEWGDLVQKSFDQFPKMDFYIIAGDLVNDGDWRNEWDEFFAGGAGVFDRTPLVPCLGNHDVNDDLEAEFYLESFALPTNGPPNLDPERAYHFTYGNALFVVLDSNLPVETQSDWLEEVLSASDTTWKFAMYHHPAYSSRGVRDNEGVREQWGAVFDEHGVDIAFQGHDHAYLRTYPMRDGERVESPNDGTIYVVSVSGTKFYDQDEHDYTEIGFTETMTYQTIDIETNPDRLVYKAYDLDGEVRDEFVIEK